MIFLKYRKFALIFSIVLVLVSIAVLGFYGLRLSTDFTGGTLWELDFKEKTVSLDELRAFFAEIDLVDPVLQLSGTNLIIRTKLLEEAKHQRLLEEIKNRYSQVEEVRFDSVGPIIGEELKRKSVWATVLAIVGILAYVAFAFRKVAKPSSSWKFGLVTIIALIHDVIITVGIFAVLGRFFNVEVGLPFVAAVLTILGYSVNDTVVVFDRIRENLRKQIGKKFNEVIEISLNQTIGRSIITSLLVVFTLLAIFLWGGITIKYFALALLIGISFGTYSSIFVATFLLTVLQRSKS